MLARAGTYYLREPLVLGPEDSGSAEAPVVYAAHPGERATLSGGRKLDCGWKPYRNGIMLCRPQAGAFTQLFVNGKRQHRARYPNYDVRNPRVDGAGYVNAAGRIDGKIEDPRPHPNQDMTFSGEVPRGIKFNPETFTKKKWARPEEAVIHIFQASYWGNLQWQVKDIDWTNNLIWFGRGGWQIGAKWARNPADVNKKSRFFIENVFEELDSPGEWYLDKSNGILYYLPEEGVDLNSALVEAPMLEQVIRFAGSEEEQAHHITVDGFRIAHTASTFLGKYETPSLSDWAIHRGGAMVLEGATDCAVRNCWFDAVGGNGVFVSGHNRRAAVTGCKFTNAGDSAVCFVGSFEATGGTRREFPYECQASNNLVRDCGAFGKQVAGVYISRAKRITAAHNLIYNLPRAGICIGDGTWGGHVIEYNHVHHTVLETSDHGPFNAWGRDRYWSLLFSQSWWSGPEGRAEPGVSIPAGNVLLDAMEPTIIRNNLFRAEKPGWGIDIDDGGSNYQIHDNLCIGMAVKFRDGDHRIVQNNIFVNPFRASLFDCTNQKAENRFLRNIIVAGPEYDRPDMDIRYDPKMEPEFLRFIWPALDGPWIEESDYNLIFNATRPLVVALAPRGKEYAPRSLSEWQALGFDTHSIAADPMFMDPRENDYRVKPESPALKLGFKNFDMGHWGLTDEFPKVWLSEEH